MNFLYNERLDPPCESEEEELADEDCVCEEPEMEDEDEDYDPIQTAMDRYYGSN